MPASITNGFSVVAGANNCNFHACTVKIKHTYSLPIAVVGEIPIVVTESPTPSVEQSIVITKPRTSFLKRFIFWGN